MQSFLMRLHLSIYIIYMYNKVDIYVSISQQRDGVVFIVNDSVTVMPQTGGAQSGSLENRFRSNAPNIGCSQRAQAANLAS